MNKTITKILATMAFICLALPFVNAQTGATLLDTNFSDWIFSGGLSATGQGNGTFTNLPGTSQVKIQGPSLNNSSTPNAGTSTEYPDYFRFGSDCGISSGSWNQYLDITPSQPFVNGGRITVVVSTNSSAAATDIFYIADAASFATATAITDVVPLAAFNQIGKTFTTETFDLPESFTGTHTLRLYRLNTTVFLHAIKIETNGSSIPEVSDDATLKSLAVNGNPVALATGQTDYTVDVPFGTTEVPTVTATANNENATVLVTDATDLTGETTIDVTAEDGVTKLQYTVSFNVLPQLTLWNFSTFTQGDIPAGTFDCLFIKGAASGTAVSIDANNKSMDGYSFTQRLKLGGAGNPATGTLLPTERYASFPVAGNATITIYGMSSSSNTERVLNVTDGTNLIGVLDDPDGNSIKKAVIDYTGTATNIYMYSVSSGFNIYAILVEGELGDCTMSDDATLKSLTVNGTDILEAGQTDYTVDLPAGTTAVPTVTANANDLKATVTVTAAADLTGKTTIDVTAQDGTELQYTVSFNVLLPDDIKNVTLGKEVESVGYYDMLGRPVPAATTGLIIVKTIYKDGSFTNAKVYRQRK